jgi:hypothetical protein
MPTGNTYSLKETPGTDLSATPVKDKDKHDKSYPSRASDVQTSEFAKAYLVLP